MKMKKNGNYYDFFCIIFLIFIIIFATIPGSFLKLLFPKGISAEFTLSYGNADSNFGIIDYSGLEYFVNGEGFITDSNVIDFFINSEGETNFTMYFGGVTYERLFTEDIAEAIILNTKTISSVVMWDDIFVPIKNTGFTLQWYDGSTWIDIQTITTDVNGLALITGLICGLYRLSETGAEFEINISTTSYTENLYIEANKTTIDVDYISSLTGITTVDLSMVAWTVKYLTQSATIGVHCDGIIVDEVAGIITYYNLVNTYAWSFDITGYPGLDAVTLNLNAFNQINIPAKSLEVNVVWDSNLEPAEGIDYELFWNDGTEFVSLGIFTTDVNGQIIFTENLPIGTYKFDDLPEFSITAVDLVHTENYLVESILGKEEYFYLGFERETKPNIFSLLYVINLIILKIMLTPILEPLTINLNFCLFGFRPQSLTYVFSQRLIFHLKSSKKVFK